MPRLTIPDYLEFRRWLSQLWVENSRSFAIVSPRDQDSLHEFFLPSISMTDDDLLRYLAKISADQPSLPQCAGRALKKLQAGIEAGQPESGLTVRAVARPAVDADAIARVLAKLARELDKQDQNAA